MKILHLASEYKWTGPAEPALGLVRSLGEIGCQVSLAVPSGPPETRWRKAWGRLIGRPKRAFEGMTPERARNAGVRVVEELGLNRYAGPLDFLRQVKALREYVLREGIDILHLHLPHDHYLGLAAVGGIGAFSGKRRIPCRLVFHSYRSRPYRSDPIHRRIMRLFADHFFFTSEKLAKKAGEDLGLDETRVSALYASVDLERYQSGVSPIEDFRARWGLEPEWPLIGVVARLQPHRQHEFLFRAFQGVLKEIPEARLVLIGRGEMMIPLRKEIRGGSLAGRVIFSGYLQSEYPAVLRSLICQVFLVPGADGGCRAAVEGMACGLPLVVSDRGVLPEIVQDGRNGFVVTEGDVEGFSNALLNLLRNPETREEMGRASRILAEERHDPMKNALRVRQVYEGILRKTGSETSVSA